MAPTCLLFVSVALLVAGVAAQEGAAVTYEQLKPTRGQWTIDIATTQGADKDTFTAIKDCNQTALTAPCLQPLLTADNSDKVQFKYELKGKQLQTTEDLPVKHLEFRACYAKPYTVDRPWRKPSPIVAQDKSCPFFLKVTEPQANNSYTVTWKVPKNATKAAWYTNVLTVCQNGTGTTYCGFDTSANQTYVGTVSIDSVPTGMKIAAAVCSSIGPLFLAAYFLKDTLMRKKV